MLVVPRSLNYLDFRDNLPLKQIFILLENRVSAIIVRIKNSIAIVQNISFVISRTKTIQTISAITLSTKQNLLYIIHPIEPACKSTHSPKSIFHTSFDALIHCIAHFLIPHQNVTPMFDLIIKPYKIVLHDFTVKRK